MQLTDDPDTLACAVDGKVEHTGGVAKGNTQA